MKDAAILNGLSAAPLAPAREGGLEVRPTQPETESVSGCIIAARLYAVEVGDIGELQ